MLHDKPSIQFCLFNYLPFAIPFCLMHTDCLVKLAHRSNAFASGIAPCIILRIPYHTVFDIEYQIHLASTGLVPMDATCWVSRGVGVWLVPMDATCWVSRGVDVEAQYSKGSSCRPCFLLVIFYLLFLWLWIMAFSVPGYYNLFTGSALNSLEVVPLHTYIVWFTSVTPCTRSVNCLLALLHFRW